MEFRWNEWNEEHIAKHGVEPEEAERVVEMASRPWPLAREDDKWLVWGREKGGRRLQVVYVLDEDDTAYIIHVRPLTENEKRRLNRSRRRRPR